MKKIFYSLFTLATMAMANTACTDELESAVTDANEVAVTFEVQLENAAGSRAIGDGTTAKELQYAVYKAEGDGIGTIIEALSKQTTIKDDLTAEVTFTLVKGQTYNFMFWAQKPGYTATADKAFYKLDKKSGEVSVNYKGTANEEGRDAFYAVEKALKVTGPINKTITLKRPFAQINVGTSIGSLADASKADVTIKKSSMTIKNAATLMNLYTGKVSASKDAVEVSYTLADIPELTEAPTDAEGGLKDVVLNGSKQDYEYLAMSYILVDDHNLKNGVEDGAQNASANVEFTIYDDADKAINTFNVPNVTVQRNWRTNIIGDILNENVTFNVVIDAEFDKNNGEDHNYNIAEELAYAAVNGGTVTLQEDVTLDEPLLIENGANVVLDLNGKTIKGTYPYDSNDNLTSSVIAVQNGTLTIKGTGTIENEHMYTFQVRNGATLNIEGGIFKGQTTIVNVVEGTANISGGEFSAKPYNNDYRYTLNCYDTNYRNGKAKIIVTGGKFTNFNPQNNAAEGNNTNFVPNGYKSESNNNVYTVTKE